MVACGSHENAGDADQPDRGPEDAGARDSGSLTDRFAGGDTATGSSDAEPDPTDAGDSGNHVLPDQPDGGLAETCAGGEPAGSADGGLGSSSPVRLTTGTAVPSGVTADGYVVYRERPTLYAAPLAGGTPAAITDRSGTVAIKNRLVLLWSDPNYETGVGDLTIWSAPNCPREIGQTLLAADSVRVSPDGNYLLFAANVTDETMDVVVASRDLAERRTLVTDVGHAGEETCRPEYGFAGERIVVAWCRNNSTAASIDLFERGDGGWTARSIATDARPSFSSDEAGERIVYLTQDSVARLWEGGDQGEIDRTVSWTLLLPDGSELLYAVGDQLRRTPLPDIVPVPIVTNRFAHVAAWSPGFDYVAYSSTITYEGGERRDLLFTPTSQFNPTPERLVPSPDAQLSRSVFTSDGGHLLYLSGAPSTLHMRAVTGGEARTFENVDTSVAARDGLVVFSNNRSDPMVYPIVADLNVVDANESAAPALLQSRIVDGRSFYTTPDGSAVVYARPAGAPEEDVQGIWVHPLP